MGTQQPIQNGVTGKSIATTGSACITIGPRKSGSLSELVHMALGSWIPLPRSVYTHMIAHASPLWHLSEFHHHLCTSIINLGLSLSTINSMRTENILAFAHHGIYGMFNKNLLNEGIFASSLRLTEPLLCLLKAMVDDINVPIYCLPCRRAKHPHSLTCDQRGYFPARLPGLAMWLALANRIWMDMIEAMSEQL